MPAPALTIRVFISCPRDLQHQRRVVESTLVALNAEAEFSDKLRIITYSYDNDTPHVSAVDAQDAVNTYTLRVEDADIVVCMFWRIMGSPTTGYINPSTNQPYLSGTEYEYLTAYEAYQHNSTPVVLLYRSHENAEAFENDEQRDQLALVEQFFARFKSGDLKGYYGAFRDDKELSNTVRHDVAKVLKERLWSTFTQDIISGDDHKPVYFGLPLKLRTFIGREEALKALREKLLTHRTSTETGPSVTLYGMAGLGKTTLARALCDDPEIREAYPDGVLWATLGQHPDFQRIQRDWVHGLGGDERGITSQETGRFELKQRLGNRSMLLIIDNVWDMHAAAQLLVDAPNCCTLVTTRDASQAQGTELVPLDLMSPADSRELLRTASHGKVQDNALLDTISKRLGYLPYSLNIIASMLHNRPWSVIEQALDGGELVREAAGQLGLFAELRVSVFFLQPEERKRFYELAIFQPTEPLDETAVARLWRRTGNVSPTHTSQLLQNFRDFSLVQQDNTLHDLVVDYLRTIVPEDERRNLHDTLCQTYGDIEDYVNLLDDDNQYGWKHVAWHLSQAERQDDLRNILTNADFLIGKLTRLGSSAILNDLSLLKDDPDTQKIGAAIRAGAPVLEQEPSELENQIIGRVGHISPLRDATTIVKPHAHIRTQSMIPADPSLLRVFNSKRILVSCYTEDHLIVQAQRSERGADISVWRNDTGTVVQKHAITTQNSSYIETAAISSNGCILAFASGMGDLHFFDVSAANELPVIITGEPGITSCALNVDGSILACGFRNGNIAVFDVHSRQQISRFQSQAHIRLKVFISPDGLHILSVGSYSQAGDESNSLNRMLLWQANSGQKIRDYPRHAEQITACVFSPDGNKILSASTDRTLRLWDVVSGTPLHEYHGHAQPISACAFSPDGSMIISASDDRTLRLWDVVSEEVIHEYHGHTKPITTCAFSSDGQSIASSDEEVTRLWKVSSQLSPISPQLRQRHSDWIVSCAFDMTGQRVISASKDRTLRLWDAEAGMSSQVFRDAPSRIIACAYAQNRNSPDRVYVLTSDCSLHLWNIETGNKEFPWVQHANTTAGALSQNGQLAISADSASHIPLKSASWNATNAPVRISTNHEIHVSTLRRWDIVNRAMSEIDKWEGNWAVACALNTDGKYALYVTNENEVKLYSVLNTRLMRRFPINVSTIMGCALSPQGDYALLAHHDGTVHLLNLRTEHDTIVWRNEAPISSCAFSPIGKRIVVGDTIGGVHFLDLANVSIKAYDTKPLGPINLPARPKGLLSRRISWNLPTKRLD